MLFVGSFPLAQVPSLQEATLSRAAKTVLLAVEFENADARDALRWLFHQARIGGTLSPDVQGVVTLSLRNVTWETALQNVTRQVDATYRVERGWYEVVAREPYTSPYPAESAPEPIQAEYQKMANAIAAGQGRSVRSLLTPEFEARNATETKRGEAAVRVLVDTVRRWSKFEVKQIVRGRSIPARTEEIVVGYARPNESPLYFRDFWQETASGRWQLAAREETALNPVRRFRNAKFSDVLGVIGRDLGVLIEAGIYADRRVDVDLTGLSFEAALHRLIEPFNLTYRIEGGVYQIVPRI